MKLSKNLTDEKAAEIAQQQFFDALKHTTTLSTGTIVLLGTFLEKLFQNPNWKVLVGFSFGLLGISVLASVVLMFWHAMNAEEDLGTLSSLGFGGYLALGMVSSWGFGLGIICFVIFILKNL